MKCRVGCGACCVAPSISSYIPGMPNGKLAGVRCIQLDKNNYCKLFEQSERPAICNHFQASVEMCGQTAQEAYNYLKVLEEATK
ncbi:MAG: YkgJ family cysteine cluster protein [Clostridiales bacterium]|nr:YkgJ family cysteine cluster protein [Clostridiales bacterium]